MKSDFKLLAVLLLLLSIATAARREFAAPQFRHQPARKNTGSSEQPLAYINKKYGFQINLPQSWNGFAVLQEQWSGKSLERSVHDQSGPQLRIRHPKYTTAEPYEDIPIMVFTHTQWHAVRRQALGVSAAPFPPSEIARNSRYVFATPPRFYYDFATGYEDVLRILGSGQVHTFTPNVDPPRVISKTPQKETNH